MISYLDLVFSASTQALIRLLVEENINIVWKTTSYLVAYNGAATDYSWLVIKLTPDSTCTSMLVAAQKCKTIEDALGVLCGLEKVEYLAKTLRMEAHR